MKRSFLLSLLLLMAASCTEKKTGPRDKEELKTRADLRSLAAKHNAATGWFTSWLNVSSVTNAAPRYTFQIRQDLIREDGRPVLLQCNVRDVDRHGDQFILYGVTQQIWSPGYLRLKCSSNLAAIILRGPKQGVVSIWNAYGIVANITSVSPTSLWLKAEREGDDATVTVDSFNSRVPFTAEGECIDLLPLDSPVFDF